jgi:enterochelin esterase-like enzyme
VAAVGLVGAGVFEGTLPGRPRVQELLGLNGDDGFVPDVEAGPVEEGSFVSSARGGVETGWALLRPPGVAGPLPLVVALHQLGADHATLTSARMALDRFLAAAVADGVPPFAIASADGGRTYWHPRPSGEDAGSMITEELLPMLGERTDLDLGRIGFLGWSMGGYGSLRLGGQLGRDRVAAVAAVSPALWTDPDDASKDGFEDSAEYEQFTVFGRQEDLDGIAVRVDCGTGDPFYRSVEAYVDGFPDDADLTNSFEPGGHDAGYWRRMLPAELAFLGEHVAGEGG